MAYSSAYYAIENCPQCGQRWHASAQGEWGPWWLWEAVCGREHYWAADLRSRRALAPMGYRMTHDGMMVPEASLPTSVPFGYWGLAPMLWEATNIRA